MKESVLITGSTGFVGQNVTSSLLRQGFTIYAIVRSKNKFVKIFGENNNNIIPIEVRNPELRDYSFYKEILEENDIHYIIHIAAIVGERDDIPWEHYYRVNVIWTRNLAIAFLKANVNKKLFIFTSSVGVYGTVPSYLPADEEHPYRPDGKYHLSKVLAEYELLTLRRIHNFPLAIIRPTILYGKGDKGFLYKVFRLVRRRAFILFNNPIINLLDVEVFSQVCLRLLDTRINGIFNIADKPIALEGLIRHIKSMVGGGFVKVSNAFGRVLEKLALSNSTKIKIKLISSSWYYNVRKMYYVLNIYPRDTVEQLKKYIHWYTRNE